MAKKYSFLPPRLHPHSRHCGSLHRKPPKPKHTKLTFRKHRHDSVRILVIPIVRQERLHHLQQLQKHEPVKRGHLFDLPVVQRDSTRVRHHLDVHLSQIVINWKLAQLRTNQTHCHEPTRTAKLRAPKFRLTLGNSFLDRIAYSSFASSKLWKYSFRSSCGTLYAGFSRITCK